MITYLYGHWNVLLANVVVVLVSVEHDDGISQGKTCVVGHKRRAIHLLQEDTERRNTTEQHQVVTSVMQISIHILF